VLVVAAATQLSSRGRNDSTASAAKRSAPNGKAIEASAACRALFRWGGNITGVFGPAAVSLAGGLVIDANRNLGVYAVYGWGVGTGVRSSTVLQVSGSKGRGIKSITGSFADGGGGGGAGALGSVNYFAGYTDNNELVQGIALGLGGGGGPASAAQRTNTRMLPLSSTNCS
jgi:hypothetical protein